MHPKTCREPVRHHFGQSQVAQDHPQITDAVRKYSPTFAPPQDSLLLTILSI